jgi:hypothetical protein
MADLQPQLDSQAGPLTPEELKGLEGVVGQKTGKEIWVMMFATGHHQWLNHLDMLMLAGGKRFNVDRELADPESFLSGFLQVSPTLRPHLARMLKWQQWALHNHRRCRSHARLN